MPIPFNRFRVLNGSNRDVKTAKFKRSTAATAVYVNPANDLDQEEDVGAVPQGQALSHQLVNVQYFTDGVKNLAITELEIDMGGANVMKLDVWQLFLADEAGDPDTNYIVDVDLYVLNVPNDNNDYYAWAAVTFSDGYVHDFYSPMFYAP